MAAPTADQIEGRLVLVVGPSGVGKDTLIAYCRSRLSGDDKVIFPRRTITRPAGDSSEDHDNASEAEFLRQAAADAFAIQWQAHGLYYGVPASIDTSLANGRTVVVNVSRSVVDAARRSYRRLTIVSVMAEGEILAERLRGRGRETDEDIDQRLARGNSLKVNGVDVLRLDNSGSVEESGEALLRILVGRGN